MYDDNSQYYRPMHLTWILTAFTENIIITAHPSKSGGAWWYGTTAKEGKSGFFPSTYVQELENGKSLRYKREDLTDFLF